MSKSNAIYKLGRIETLVNYNNYLVKEYGIPSGELDISIDDGYTGELYTLDWDYGGGTVIVSLSDDGTKMIYAYLIGDSDGHGDLSDLSDLEVVELIKDVLKVK